MQNKRLLITTDCTKAIRCEQADEYTEEFGKRFAVELQNKEGDTMDYEYFDTESEANNFVANTVIAPDITKENIHLYYEFMSDEQKTSNDNIAEILRQTFVSRYSLVLKHFKDIGFLQEEKGGYDYDLIQYQGDTFTYGGINLTSYKSISFFNIKDTLKPIDEYIAEIKESQAYQEWIGQHAAQEIAKLSKPEIATPQATEI